MRSLSHTSKGKHHAHRFDSCWIAAMGTEMKLVVLCVVFVRVQALLLMVEEKHHAPPTHSTFRQIDRWNPEKPQTLFARRGFTEYQRSQAVKPLGDPVLKALYCSRLKENCSPDSHPRCCDPCASCHCRFFNTICRCLRLGRPCHRKT